MFCANCGQKLGDNDQYCLRCGTKTNIKPQKRCYYCGHNSKPEQIYCPKCGHRLTATTLGSEI